MKGWCAVLERGDAESLINTSAGDAGNTGLSAIFQPLAIIMSGYGMEARKAGVPRHIQVWKLSLFWKCQQ